MGNGIIHHHQPTVPERLAIGESHPASVLAQSREIAEMVNPFNHLYVTGVDWLISVNFANERCIGWLKMVLTG